MRLITGQINSGRSQIILKHMQNEYLLLKLLQSGPQALNHRRSQSLALHDA